MKRKEYFRGVIWPREPKQSKKETNYRYVIVGMLVTNEPISDIEGKNEVVIDSNMDDLAQVFEFAPKRKAKIILGDATDVLLNLSNL